MRRKIFGESITEVEFIVLMILAITAIMGFPASSDVYNKNSQDVEDRGSVTKLDRDRIGNYYVSLNTSNTYHVDETIFNRLRVGDLVVVYTVWPDWEWFSCHRITRIA